MRNGFWRHSLLGGVEVKNSKCRAGGRFFQVLKAWRELEEDSSKC